jgi:hypothetical protein
MKLLCILLLGWPMALPLRAAVLNEIRIEASQAAGTAPFSGWRRSAPFAKVQVVKLELGDEIYGAILKLAPSAGARNYRVSVQFETSMAIGN